MDRKVVLITGASSGIGLACAVHLAAQGFDVVGASRRTTPDEAWTSLVMDVDDDASVTAAVDQVVRDHGGIDAVVTCAGWGLAGPVETTPLAEARAQLDTNFFGTVRVVAAALPSLAPAEGPHRAHELDRRGHRPAVPGLLLGQQVRARGVGRGARLGAQAPRRARDPGRARQLPHRVHRCPTHRPRRAGGPVCGGRGEGHHHDGAGRGRTGRTRSGSPPSWPRC